MKRTIIYVFGPKRLCSQYFSNGEMDQQVGGWLKIGKTSENDANKNKWDSAISRVNQETHTGIPEVCKLYDVFEYPEMCGNVDDQIRDLLTNDLYDLECSKVHNKGIEEFDIKAGREFVYGVTRNQVLNAVAKFERNLILDWFGKEGFDELMKMICGNNELKESPLEPETVGPGDTQPIDVKTADDNTKWCDNLWDKVIEKVQGRVPYINNPKGRPYIFFDSTTHNGFKYDCGFSTRFGITTVSIATQEGEYARDKMNDFIKANNILSSFDKLKLKQGARNKDKWAWILSDSLDKSDAELVDWFANTIISFYNALEK